MTLSAAALQSAFPGALRAMPPMVFPGLDPHRVRDGEREWWRALVRSVFAAAGAGVPGADFDRCFDRLFTHFAGSAAWRCAPGAAELLAALRARGLRTGVLSNFDHRLPALLEALALAPLFEVVVLPSDAGAAKPDPRIFACALARLGVRAAEAVYVGDEAEDDVVASQRAGMHAIDVSTLPDLHSVESLVA
jgi:putative hydrolase of the HAD superfamily